MAGLTDYDCEGILTIGSTVMNCPAWAVMGDGTGNDGLLQLLTTADIRGDDRRIPSAVGVIAYPRRLDVTKLSFRMIVTGEVDQDGVPNADPVDGLVENLLTLWDNVIDPPATSDSLQAATWDPPGGGATRAADIHVIRCSPDQYGLSGPTLWVGRLTISIPGGRFE